VRGSLPASIDLQRDRSDGVIGPSALIAVFRPGKLSRTTDILSTPQAISTPTVTRFGPGCCTPLLYKAISATGCPSPDSAF
jgi:hypothetical protein